MFESDYEYPSKISELVAETWNSAVLDCGASKTVAGRHWFENYVNNLNEEDKTKVELSKTHVQYRFGDGKVVVSNEKAKIPAIIGQKKIFICSDIVDENIPLLLSREFMKNVNMSIDFKDDTVNILNQLLSLTITQSGHYALPITIPSKILQDIDHERNVKVTLTMAAYDNKKKALKLHSQFGHPSYEKLVKVVNSAGKEWSENSDLKNELKTISDECQTCKVFKKAPPRPVVGLPMATKFLECVAMDLKFYNSKILLHLIDHATRLSMSIQIRSKEPSVIIQAIFKNWIAIYGTTTKFLSDNGGEFANNDFLEMCESLNITYKTTAAESPWSNGIVERHNLIISQMLDKVLYETNCSIDLGLAWCINAKNSLDNMHGYSPYQLAIGQNPKLPSAISDKPPAMDLQASNKIIRENLNVLHKAREAFIKLENSERLKRAISHNIRTTNDVKYLTGDSVYYKRDKINQWRGPGKVIGQDGQQVLVKHGPTYVRVHPCRLMLENQASQKKKDISVVDNSEVQDNDNNESDDDTIFPQEREGTERVDQDIHQNIPNEIAEAIHPPRDQTLKKGIYVRVQLPGNEDWTSVKLASRAGKSTGNYSKCWNTENEAGEKQYIDFDQVDWEIKAGENTNTNMYCECLDEYQLNEVFQSVCDENIVQAKQTELSDWKDHQVYDEVPNVGQQTISVRWVISPSTENGKISAKARLCARGFEEDNIMRTDSPTCSREGVRSVLSIIASNSWTLNSIDIKRAFLQNKEIDRIIYIKPPPEANTNKIWKLRKCIYGLSDASRQWYITLKQEMTKLGVQISKVENGIFYYQNNGKLIGIMACHVDDLLWGGTDTFKHEIIDKIHSIFKIGKMYSKAFTYVGIQVNQNEDKSITVSQNNYIKSIREIKLSSNENVHRVLNKEEVHSTRRAIGQLNWAAGISRPDICFDVSICSSTINNEATVKDAIEINKIIRRIKSDNIEILIPCLDIDSLELKSFCDSSFNNLSKGGSQGAHIVFLCDNTNSCPLQWCSNRIKRVVRSTLAAETLAFIDGSETGIYLSELFTEIYCLKSRLNIKGITDNKSLFQTSNTTKNVDDKRLRVEISMIRQMLERKEIEIIHVKSENNLSNALTKKGASTKTLLATLKCGKISLY